MYDAYPLDPCAHTDTDGDGLPNDVYTSIQYTCRGTTGDPDDDNDGYLDGDDVFPLDPTEWADFDEDGLGDNADINDDNDGWSDLMEYICGTDPYDKLSFPVDTDGDGTISWGEFLQWSQGSDHADEAWDTYVSGDGGYSEERGGWSREQASLRASLLPQDSLA